MLLVIPFLTLLLQKLGDCKLSVNLMLKPSTLFQGERYTAFIYCLATGGAVSVDLYKIDHRQRNKVVSTARVTVAQKTFGAGSCLLVYSITEVQFRDAGLYLCEANDNSSGTAQENATISVNSMPAASTVISKATTRSITGSDAPSTIEDVKFGFSPLGIAGTSVGGVLLIAFVFTACFFCSEKLRRSCNLCRKRVCSGDSTDKAFQKSSPMRLSSFRAPVDEFGHEDDANWSELAATTIKPGAVQAKPSKFDGIPGDGAYETVGRNPKLITKAVANAQQKSSSRPSDFDGEEEEEERPHAVGGRGSSDTWKLPEASYIIQKPAEPPPPPLDDKAYAQVNKSKTRKSSRNADPPLPLSGNAYAVDKARKQTNEPHHSDYVAPLALSLNMDQEKCRRAVGTLLKKCQEERGDDAVVAVLSDALQQCGLDRRECFSGIHDVEQSHHEVTGRQTDSSVAFPAPELPAAFPTQQQLNVLSREIAGGWRPLATALDVPSYVCNQIRADHRDQSREQAFEMLKWWKEKNSERATSRKLQEALLSENLYDLARKVFQY